MEILKELLPGCFLLQAKRFEDHRGCFVKTYHEGQCVALGVDLTMREEFYSVSHKKVVRGMHFQLPPHDHDKLVYCVGGAVHDVLLDLRKGSSYGRAVSADLSGENARLIYIPKGIAHGFLALTDNALMLYKTSTVHMAESDGGVRWDSFGFDWDVDRPIISGRDQQHVAFGDFVSPF